MLLLLVATHSLTSIADTPYTSINKRLRFFKRRQNAQFYGASNVCHDDVNTNSSIRRRCRQFCCCFFDMRISNWFIGSMRVTIQNQCYKQFIGMKLLLAAWHIKIVNISFFSFLYLQLLFHIQSNVATIEFWQDFTLKSLLANGNSKYQVSKKLK